MQRLSVNNLRLVLFLALLTLAPLSKYPSVSMPAFNFSSFRFGLYQLIVLGFVACCIVPAAKYSKKFWRQNRIAMLSLGVLAGITITGIFGASYKARSGLLIASILLLLLAVLCSWWYAYTHLKPQLLIKPLLYAGIIFSSVGLIQFLVASITTNTFGLLCTGCNSDVFGFVRINGFAAEPQFYANALIPFFFIALVIFYKYHSRVAATTLALTSLAIGLTFSRGAFIALFAGSVLLAGIFIINRSFAAKAALQSSGLVIGAIVVSFCLLVISASVRYSNTPNIAYNTTKTMVSQLSSGTITLPTKKAVTIVNLNAQIPPQNAASIQAPIKEPSASGVVVASGNDRVTAAKLALNAWNSTPQTILVGVGAGNLGPYVNNHIDTAAPNNLTVYVYYVLLLSELGIVGLAAFLLLFLSTLWLLVQKACKDKNNTAMAIIAAILLAFMVQYLFFGSYINVTYIWIWLGIGIGLGALPLKKGIIKPLYEK